MKPKNNNVVFSKLDLTKKLTFLEDLVFNEISNKVGKNENFNNDLKLLLDIIKLKFKVKPEETLISYIDLLNEPPNTDKKNNRVKLK